MKILAIDDDEIALELLTSELARLGHEVITLPSPIGATSVIHREKVEAVFVDVVMPSMRGDRLAKLLRGNPNLERMPVILVSGDAGVELRKLAVEVGADAVLSKKEVRTGLASTIAQALRSRASAKQPPAPRAGNKTQN